MRRNLRRTGHDAFILPGLAGWAEKTWVYRTHYDGHVLEIFHHCSFSIIHSRVGIGLTLEDRAH
jgi:hypothetical protein